MKSTLTILIILLISTHLLLGQDATLKTEDKLLREELLIDKNFVKLNKKNAALQKFYEDYKNAPDSLKRANLIDKMMLESYIRDIRYKVIVTTRTPGAMVRYKSKLDPAVYLSNKPTNECVLELPIGTCILWTERDGNITSNKQAYVILSDTSILIEEKP